MFFVFDAAANRRWQTRLARSPLGSAARDVRRHPTFIIPCPRPWHARSFEAIGGHSSIHSASAPALFFSPQGPTGPTGVSQIAPRVAQAQAPRAPAGLRLGGPAGWTREFLSKILFCSRLLEAALQSRRRAANSGGRRSFLPKATASQARELSGGRRGPLQGCKCRRGAPAAAPPSASRARVAARDTEGKPSA